MSLRNSAHPPLSVLDPAKTGSDLAPHFTEQHRQIYDLIRRWQIEASAPPSEVNVTMWHANVQDGAGAIWPLAVCTGDRSFSSVGRSPARALPPFVRSEQLFAFVAPPDAPVQGAMPWTTNVDAGLVSTTTAGHPGFPGGCDYRLADLLLLCSSSEALSGQAVAEALQQLHAQGLVSLLYEDGETYLSLTAKGRIAVKKTKPDASRQGRRPQQLTDIAAMKALLARTEAPGIAQVLSTQAARLGIEVSADRLAWLDSFSLEGEAAAAAYDRVTGSPPTDNLWALHPLPLQSDPGVLQPSELRDDILTAIDRTLAGTTAVDRERWRQLDPLQRLDRRLDAAALLLGTNRATLGIRVRYNLLARWMLDWPIDVTPVQHGLAPLDASFKEAASMDGRIRDALVPLRAVTGF